MNGLRRFLAVGCIALAGAAALSAAGTAETEESNVIGISKIVSHPALDAVEQGIIDELAELGHEFEYDLQNANGEVSAANQIATKFRDDGVRLAVGIATPTAQALVNNLTEIPVVYSAVTDPVGAGLVETYESGTDNVTGVSDLTPVREQLELLLELADVEVLGHVYAAGEANAVRLAELAREAADDLGIRFVESTVANTAEVRTATQSIIGQVDAIYVSTDNTVVSALSALTSVALEAGVPVISADPTSAADFDVLAALGFDYYQMGRVTGRLVSDIIGGVDPETVPTMYMTEPEDQTMFLNLDIAEQLGLSVPESVISRATTVFEDGEIR
ncbi:MAG: ABC transporter substrate-binding protein [Spirochaetaceae bacterium]